MHGRCRARLTGLERPFYNGSTATDPASRPRGAGGYAFHHRILKLDRSVRPLLLAFLREQFPALAERYEVRYAGTHLDPEYARVIEARVERVLARVRFPIDAAPRRPQPAGQLRFAM